MEAVSYHPIIDSSSYTEEELHSMDRFASVSEIYLSEQGAFLAETEDWYNYRLVGYRTLMSEENDYCELELLVCHEALNPHSVETSICDMLSLE